MMGQLERRAEAASVLVARDTITGLSAWPCESTDSEDVDGELADEVDLSKFSLPASKSSALQQMSISGPVATTLYTLCRAVCLRECCSCEMSCEVWQPIMLVSALLAQMVLVTVEPWSARRLSIAVLSDHNARNDQIARNLSLHICLAVRWTPVCAKSEGKLAN
jgi:hypothetical protein